MRYRGGGLSFEETESERGEEKLWLQQGNLNKDEPSLNFQRKSPLNK